MRFQSPPMVAYRRLYGHAGLSVASLVEAVVARDCRRLISVLCGLAGLPVALLVEAVVARDCAEIDIRLVWACWAFRSIARRGRCRQRSLLCLPSRATSSVEIVGKACVQSIMSVLCRDLQVVPGTCIIIRRHSWRARRSEVWCFLAAGMIWRNNE